MKGSVYDTMLVGKANGSLNGRRAGNALDKRLSLLEAAVAGASNTLVNSKLLGEYHVKVGSLAIRNDVVRSFLEYAIDSGIDSGRSTLAGADYDKAKKARWPSHDQHLLAAGIGHKKVSIYVTEVQHIACAGGILRQFGFRVVAS